MQGANKQRLYFRRKLSALNNFLYNNYYSEFFLQENETKDNFYVFLRAYNEHTSITYTYAM